MVVHHMVTLVTIHHVDARLLVGVGILVVWEHVILGPRILVLVKLQLPHIAAVIK